MAAQRPFTFGVWARRIKLQHPPRKPPPSLFSAVVHHVQVMHPVEFQLPEEIRTFFKDGMFEPKFRTVAVPYPLI